MVNKSAFKKTTYTATDFANAVNSYNQRTAQKVAREERQKRREEAIAQVENDFKYATTPTIQLPKAPDKNSISSVTTPGPFVPTVTYPEVIPQSKHNPLSPSKDAKVVSDELYDVILKERERKDTEAELKGDILDAEEKVKNAKDFNLVERVLQLGNKTKSDKDVAEDQYKAAVEKYYQNKYGVDDSLDVIYRSLAEFEHTEEVEKDLDDMRKALFGGDKVEEFLKSNIWGGIVENANGMYAMADATVGQALKSIGWENNPVSFARDVVQKEYEELTALSDSLAVDTFYKDNTIGKGIRGAVAFLPDVAALWLTKGKYKPASPLFNTFNLGPIASTATKSQKLAATVNAALTTVSKNPMYWTSFARTYGLDYERAFEKIAAQNLAKQQEAGVEPSEFDKKVDNAEAAFIAGLYATLTSSINALVEMGGAQALPAKLQGKSSGYLFSLVESAIGEGLEENIQGIISEVNEKLLYYQEKELGEIFDLNRIAEEFKVGSLVGLLLGGGQTIYSASGNVKYAKLGKTVKKTMNAEDLITYARKSSNEIIRNVAKESTGKNISNQNLGMLYAYAAKDVTTAFNSVNDVEGTANVFKEFMSEDIPQTIKTMAFSQAAEKFEALSAETNVLEELLNVDNTTTKTESKNAGLTDLSAANKKVDPVQKSVNEATGVKDLTEQQQLLKKVANHYGVKIDFKNLDETRTDKNGKQYVFSPEGYYDPATNTIVLNTNDYYKNHRPLLFILKHEMTHSMEKAGKDFEKFVAEVETSEAFENYAKTRINSKTGKAYTSLDEWYEDIVNRYKKAGEPLGNETRSERTGAKYEAVADFVADVLFLGETKTAEQFLGSLSVESRNRFIAWIQDVLAKLKTVFIGDSRYTEIERLEKQFLEVANKVAKMNKTEQNKKTTTEEGGGMEYSIAYTTNNKPVLVVNDDILKNATNNKEKVAIVKQSLGRFKKVPIKGQTIHFISDTKREYTNSRYSQWLAKNDQSIFDDKMRVAAHPQDIVYATTDYINEPPSHTRKDNIVDFARGTLLIDVAGRQYEGEVVIGFTKSGICELHDIVHLTPTQFEYKKETVSMSIDSNESLRSDTTSKHSIPDSPESVNENLSESTESVGVEYDKESNSASPVSYSLASWERSDYVTNRNIAAKELAEAIGVTEKQAKDYIDSINSVAKVIADDQMRLDYDSSKGRSSFVSNAEYGGSVDFSTLCPKRKILTGTFSAIQKALKNSALTAEEILDIRNKMKEKGLEVSCGLCYVEGSRAQMGKFSKEFIERYKKTNPKYVPNMYDVNTPEGVEQMRIDHPEVYEAYEKFWNNKGVLNAGDTVLFASQQKPKLYQTRTEYNGEILKKFESDGNVVEKNKNGGLRLQSFSDFEIVHLIDTMQVILDMSKVGLAGQAYTKVPEFALALGGTGLKINLSLIAKDVDENGNLVFDDIEGMPFETAMHIRNMYSDNVGTILVVFNDQQLKAALADNRVDFIIPFHRSQWKKAQYEKLGLPKGTKDYTYQQNEKFIKPVFYTTRNGNIGKRKATNYMPNEYWDFSKSGKENAENYLKMCAENNKRPKFYKLLVDNKDGSYSLQPDGSTDGYWKLLIDFKMYNNDGVGVPQKPVKPDFNMDESIKMLDEYKGGHQSFPVDKETVDEFVSEYRNKHKMDDFVEQNKNAESIKNPYSLKFSLPDNATPIQIGNAYKNGEISEAEYERLINQSWEKQIKQEGTIDQGEMVAPPNKPNPTPTSVKPNTKVSEHIRTILESGYASKEMETYLKEKVLDGLGSFTPTSNEKDINNAVRKIQQQGYQNSLNTWRTGLDGILVGSHTVAQGEALLRLAMEQNNAVDIVNISADLAELSTRTAQSLQAFSLLKRMGGIGQLVYIQRSVNKLNQDLQKRSHNKADIVKVDKKLAERLAKAETEGEYEVIYNKIMQDVADQVPATFLDKWNAWRYMAMLFNPTTHVRNMSGNAIFVPAVRMKDLLALAGEKAFVKQENRTKSLKVKKEYQDFASKDFEQVKSLLTGTGKYNPTDDIKERQKIFKNKALEGLRRLNFNLLEAEDALFLKRHYRHALGGFLQARKLDLNNLTSKQLAEARNYAFNEALKATYRDASMAANIISQLSKLPVGNVLVEGVLPFKKTPINVLKRGMEYSPVGLVKTLSSGLWQLKTGKITATQFIDGLAAGVTGTGLTVLGALLASLGIIKGGFDDEESLDRLMGKQEYSVQIGNKSYTIDWAAPASIPFFMGVAAQEYKPEEDGDFLTNLYNFGIQGFEPILNLSMLSGINDVINSVSYAESNENLPQLVGAAIGSYFSQLLPTIFGKTANVIDNTRRMKYIDKTSNVPELVQSALNKIYAKTPWLSKNRAEYIDAWGETKYTGNFFERFFQQFVSPGYASTVDEKAISEEALRLYRETGDKSVIPSTPAKYFEFNDTRRNLSKEEYFDYATLRGQMQADIVSEAINSEAYKKLNDEQKALVVSTIYSFANAYAKTTLKYSYEEVAAMVGKDKNEEYILTKEKWDKLDDKAKRLLVNDKFFNKKVYEKAYKAYQKGESVSEVIIKQVLKDTK